MKRRRSRFAAHCVILVFLALAASAPAGSQDRRSTGQTVYVPTYSHIYYGDKERTFLLAVTLSIRNTDMKIPITLLAADYYDTSGALIEKYQKTARVLKPMESVRYVVKESDTRGGSGANFIVRWRSSAPASGPLVETIMIGTAFQQGISFTSRGVVIAGDGK